MPLDALPMVAILIGLVLYVVLAGADFGAPVWQVLAGRGPRAEAIREHAHASMAPVWEANHVWLIFVITVMWTAYPAALASIASTLYVPLFAAGLGVIVRGGAYALRTGTSSARQLEAFDMASAASSVLTPFALGTVVGAVASGRVPVGNAAGDPVTSWLNPTSIAIGVLAVATSAYLAAVFLAADAMRREQPEIAAELRRRALGAAVLAGAVAVAGLVVLRSDARGLFDALVSDALPAVIVSGLAGIATLHAVWRGRYEVARYSAALAVAAVVAGWAIAQSPRLLPDLTVEQAAAPRDTIVAVLVAIAAGALILFPSLGLLFRLVLGGRLGHGPYEDEEPAAATASAVLAVSAPGLAGRAAVACLVAGLGFLTVADAGWAHAVGVVALAGFVVLGFAAALPELLAG
jgi:cytochrome d ubiquinol oxidase subunit II